MDRLIRYFAERHLVVHVIVATLVIVGYATATRTAREGMPNVSMPMIVVKATLPGAAARDVHRGATEVIDATEFAGRFIHGLGHSIGLDVHDGAGLNDASTVTLEAGMVFTVEPGVYVPGVGGVVPMSITMPLSRPASKPSWW